MRPEQRLFDHYLFTSLLCDEILLFVEWLIFVPINFKMRLMDLLSTFYHSFGSIVFSGILNIVSFWALFFRWSVLIVPIMLDWSKSFSSLLDHLSNLSSTRFATITFFMLSFPHSIFDSSHTYVTSGLISLHIYKFLLFLKSFYLLTVCLTQRLSFLSLVAVSLLLYWLRFPGISAKSHSIS